MAIDKVVAPLLRVPLFCGLKPAAARRNRAPGRTHAFRPGQTITQAGTPGDGAYLIVSGEAVRMPELRSDDAAEPIEPGSLSASWPC